MLETPAAAEPRRARRIAAIVFLIALLPTAFFALRSFGTFRLLRSAYEAGAPMTSNVRAWMTLGYIANAYRTPEAALVSRLELPPQTDPNASLKTLADRAGVSPAVYAQRVQRALAALSPATPSDRAAGATGWLGGVADQALSALLVYGYPALGLTLLLGAIGLPLPDGVATAVAGSLASQGRMNSFWAVVVIVAASLAGDVIGYGLGRVVSRTFIERHGHWLGFSRSRRVRAQSLFDRWGLLTVFLTRTFISYLSSIASVLAGLSLYRLSIFLPTALAGRLVWTAGYFGLGYAIGGNWEAATSFLGNLSLLLLLLALLVASSAVASGRFAASR